MILGLAGADVEAGSEAGEGVGASGLVHEARNRNMRKGNTLKCLNGPGLFILVMVLKIGNLDPLVK